MFSSCSLFLHTLLVVLSLSAAEECKRTRADYDVCYPLLEKKAQTMMKYRGVYATGEFRVCNECDRIACVELGYSHAESEDDQSGGGYFPLETICISNATDKLAFFGRDGLSYRTAIKYQLLNGRILFISEIDQLSTVVPLPEKLYQLQPKISYLVLDYPGASSCFSAHFHDTGGVLMRKSCSLTSSKFSTYQGKASTNLIINGWAFVVLLFIIPGVYVLVQYRYNNDDLKLSKADEKKDKVPMYDLAKGKKELEDWAGYLEGTEKRGSG
ncbi:hypothetical protein L596_019485 [Steinernema carpocapsae]|uniref:Uncharacterized protein n=1 Tax=Steinernema carpocapsae TaxID=34508 RepID=A0A4U5MQN9_STECR|nr:hypothetical protein L596_019485 [Steinernema carpocapsae]